MDTKKEDTDVKTALEAPAMPAPGEPGPGPSAVPSEPLHGPVDVAEDSMEGLQAAFRALSVEEVLLVRRGSSVAAPRLLFPGIKPRSVPLTT